VGTFYLSIYIYTVPQQLEKVIRMDKETCTRVFKEALIAIVTNWKDLTCQHTEERINKLE
jgi:hypothetical protein